MDNAEWGMGRGGDRGKELFSLSPSLPPCPPAPSPSPYVIKPGEVDNKQYELG